MADGLWEHPDWEHKVDNDGDGPSLEYVDIDSINDWVVKLTFKRFGEAEPLSGSGFFLNLPDIQDKHVILTAAHNLISNQKRSADLKVIYNNPFEVDPDNPKTIKFADDKHGAIIEIPVDNTEGSRNVHICERYNGGGDSSLDYGVITIPRTSANAPRGFGFSLALAHRTAFKGNVHVSGFRTDKATSPIKKTLRPATSLAVDMTYHNNHVEYQATTERGMGGSPVWVEYQKYLAVVAIHNRGYRGTLLTVDLLRDVFKWLDGHIRKEARKGAMLMHEGVQIQVNPDDLQTEKPHPAADRGLFLSFMSNTGFGRVRLRFGTKFDWMPAQVDPNGVVYYAASTEGKWLAFNVSAKKYQGVELREKLDGPECFLLKLVPDDTALG
ncbi:hypothetical protein M413DRAFT_6655 [Hebeloma cylindrosporum]|uniref:Serine protease n=1 Tax=Hebeloma cylindrosporum TaxID=76867 RepID=A0A0C2YJ13_HEBCY|nr:hypothetical protein M413DRAFT_6655 [Hebeloma cylindrosporum h7]